MKTNKFIRIICEGQITEPNYFRGIIKAKGIRGAEVKKAKDNSPIGIVKKAKEQLQIALKAKIPKEDIIIWAVFDRDQHANLENAIEMARVNNISVAFSNICFEFWILLHYERCTRPFTSCDEVIKYIRKNYDSNYLKKNDHYQRLYDKIITAISNNKWLLDTHWNFELQKGTPIYNLNPYTDVYKLVNILLNTE